MSSNKAYVIKILSIFNTLFSNCVLLQKTNFQYVKLVTLNLDMPVNAWNKVRLLQYDSIQSNHRRLPRGCLVRNRGNKIKEITISSTSKHIAVLFSRTTRPYLKYYAHMYTVRKFTVISFTSIMYKIFLKYWFPPKNYISFYNSIKLQWKMDLF